MTYFRLFLFYFSSLDFVIQGDIEIFIEIFRNQQG